MNEDIRKQAAWLAWIYQGVADGRKMQFCREGGWHDMKFGPDIFSKPELWRLKPEPRECVSVVDVLTESCAHRKVLAPFDWPFGMKVRVTEILEEE